MYVPLNDSGKTLCFARTPMSLSRCLHVSLASSTEDAMVLAGALLLLLVIRTQIVAVQSARQIGQGKSARNDRSQRIGREVKATPASQTHENVHLGLSA